MEIERKFLIQKMPEHPEQYKSHLIEQAYLNVRPVVRVRREDENYYMTYKGGGMMAREEYNLPLECRFICPSSSESRWQYYYQKTLSDTFSCLYNRAGCF